MSETRLIGLRDMKMHVTEEAFQEFVSTMDKRRQLEGQLAERDRRILALIETRRSYTPPPLRSVSNSECIVSVAALEALSAITTPEKQNDSI